jgi:hypothetical protein
MSIKLHYFFSFQYISNEFMAYLFNQRSEVEIEYGEHFCLYYLNFARKNHL